jgi:hypothetical protein
VTIFLIRILVKAHRRMDAQTPPIFGTPGTVLSILESSDDKACPRLKDGEGFHIRHP